MAEFCLECWNKLNDTNYKPIHYVLSRDLEFCEECEQFKRVVVKRRCFYYLARIRQDITDLKNLKD